jgi:hydroxymethylbilane synthase
LATSTYDIINIKTAVATGTGVITPGRTFSVVCRGSWLSLAQAEIFKARVNQFFPDIKINVIVRATEGDKNQSTPLHLVEGKDFFTKDIQQSLRIGEADFALHSMKDVSSEDFFSNSSYAIISRDMLQDVAVFNENVIAKINMGETLIIGTSSPRRSNMALDFLQKALPHCYGKTTAIEARPVRGNVDIRLQKLNNGDYDGLILAAAGLNRLLQYEASGETVESLLADKKIMLLPLFECPPAAGQGAVVAETDPANREAVVLLKAIEDKALTIAIEQERNMAYRYGFGCSQQFGSFYINTGTIAFGYAAGKDDKNRQFTEWDFDMPLHTAGKVIFSATDYMKDFFTYSYNDDVKINAQKGVVFVSSHKAVHNEALAAQLKQKKVWAAGTRTWFALAKKGLWVNGCADGLGLGFILPILAAPLFSIQQKDLQVITNTSSALHWQKDGIAATGTYALHPTHSETIVNAIANADIIFWTSFQQYEACKQYISKPVTHCCPAGKTATLLSQQGIIPVIFPAIKAFIQWKELNIP